MNNRKPAPSGALLPQQDGLPPSVIASAIRNTPPAAWHKNDSEKDSSMPPQDTSTLEFRREQASIVKTIGQRLKSSRELSNLSLSEAARRLGYSNPSKLSKVENATDTNSVPLWLIRDAAQLYDVSTEFLFGLSDDFECGAHRGMTPYLLDQWERMRNRDLRALITLQQRIEAVTAVIPTIRRDAQGVIDAINRLSDLNGDAFLDLRGGSILNAAAVRLKKTAGDALEAERRLRLVLAEPAATETTDET
jgi:transcriptional regulator with XRE-family HTH domain